MRVLVLIDWCLWPHFRTSRLRRHREGACAAGLGLSSGQQDQSQTERRELGGGDAVCPHVCPRQAALLPSQAGSFAFEFY